MENKEEFGLEINPENEKEIRARMYADIMLDWTFKHLFGPQGKYKEGLVSLLNSIIPDVKVKSIEYIPTEVQGNVSTEKTSVMDLRCISDEGMQFAVEIQNYREEDYFERCIAYACKLFLEQNRRGGKYGKIPVYVVSILSEKVSGSLPMYQHLPNQVVYDHTMIEKISGIFAPRTISTIFVDTGKFRKEIQDCTSEVDKWFFLLKHSKRIREYSGAFQSEVFRRILEALKITSFTQEEFNMYYEEERQKEKLAAQYAAAINQGLSEGRNQGLSEGRKQGFEEGLAKGLEKGLEKVARKMLDMGIEINTISQSTGLSFEEIENL